VRPAIAFGALALGVGGFSVTTLPRPPFPGPTALPIGHRLVLVSSTHLAPGNLENDNLTAPANTFRGLAGQQTLFTANRVFDIYGKDGSTGRYLVAYDKVGHKLYAFDFKNYGWPPRIKPGDREFVYEQPVWAQEAGGTLYVENAHSTYAYSSYGQNAYITAIGLKTKRATWRSPALVANAKTFLVTRHYVITGYGFTDEPDFLFLLDRATGRVLDRLLLPDAPDKITWQSGLIHVRTYDHLVLVRLRGA
jgi:hypothetical protein